MSEVQESPPDGSEVSQESQGRQDDHDDDDDDDDDDCLSASSLNQTEYNESTAEKAYVESNNSKKQLFLMCVGLTHGGRSVFDLDAEPWNTIRKRDIKPTRVEYAQEVSRRGALLDMQRSPKAANWGSNKCIRWLEEHPPKDEQDILFLKNEVQRLKAIVLEAHQERQEQEARQSGQWRGAIPYMRLIMCLIQDDIKSSFLRRADARTRQELDARNSEARPQTAFELIADRWNDEHFNPVAPSSNCHEDFLATTDCSHSRVAMMMRAAPQKVEDILTSMRSNLLRIIQNWERSGQGEGGRHEPVGDDPEELIIFDTTSDRFGSLSSRSACALQNRSAFLCGKPSYLLYFWELADQHQFLQSALQRLDDDLAASDAASAPSVSSSSHSTRRRQREDPQLSEGSGDIVALSQSIRFLAQSEDVRQVRRRIGELQDQARNYRRMYAEDDDPSSARARFYHDEAQAIALEVASLQEQLITTPPRHNTTPRT